MSLQMKEPIRVLVTGGSGNLAYALLYPIANGDIFGLDQPMILHLMDIEAVHEKLDSVVMELIDCAFPLLIDIVSTSNDMVAFLRVDVALLIGAIPRRPGMERNDLLASNIKIFRRQGQALDRYAKRSVKVLVVGTPTNTNAFICCLNAPSIPKENFSALSMLDHNRALAQIATQLRVSTKLIKNVIIWGNHTDTMFPDFSHGTVEMDGRVLSIPQAVGNDDYLNKEICNILHGRGNQVLAARRKTTTLAAAKAITDHMKNWFLGTPSGEYVSMSVCSDGSYGVPPDIFFSFPVTIGCDGRWQIVPDLVIDQCAQAKILKSGEELVEEKALAIKFCER